MLFILGICLFFSISGFLMLVWKLWLVDGTMDASIAILLGGGALIFAGMGIRNSSIVLLWCMTVFLGGGSILYVALDDYYERSSARRRHLDDIKKLKQRVDFNSADWRSWRDLGEKYTKVEMYNQAVDAYKNAIRLDPPDVMKLRESLNGALGLRKLGKMSEGNICPNCKLETPSNSKTCIHCGEPMRFEFMKFVSTPDVYGDIIRYMVLGIGGAGILVLVLSHLSLEVKAVIAMATAIVCGFLVWRSIDSV